MHGSIKNTLVAAGYQKKDDPLAEAVVEAAISQAQQEIKDVAGTDLNPQVYVRLVVSGAASIIADRDIGNYAANLAALEGAAPSEAAPQWEATQPQSIDPTDIAIAAEDVE